MSREFVFMYTFVYMYACCILKSVTALPSYERFGIAGLDHNHFLKLRHRPCCRPPVVYLGIIKTFQEIIKNPPTLKFNNCVLFRQKFMSFSFRAYFTNCLRLKEKCSGSFLVREGSRVAWKKLKSCLWHKLKTFHLDLEKP